MSRRFQFSLRALLVVMLVVACYFGGIRFERERRWREDKGAVALRVRNPRSVHPMYRGGFAVNENATAVGPYITPHELSRACGFAPKTIKFLVRDGMIPCPVKYDDAGRPLFDLGDPKLAAWLTALAGRQK
jgi:hypothetical protein